MKSPRTHAPVFPCYARKNRPKNFFAHTLFLVAACFQLILFSRGPGENMIPIGNFALPVSQRPGPFFGFGQNFAEKNNIIVSATALHTKGCHQLFDDVTPALLYGVNDRLSLLFYAPIAARFCVEQNRSHGIEDVFAQAEYIFFEDGTSTVSNYMSLVGNVSLPAGSSTKVPPTGFGSPSFFVGITLGRLEDRWYYFGSPGALITATHHGHRLGNQFFYQGGIGRNIAYQSERWLLTFILEFAGIYGQRNRFGDFYDDHSGGNRILFGPSLWFATQHFNLHVGIAGFVFQKLNGSQQKNNYTAGVNIGWKFH